MSMPHFPAACPCRMSMVHVHTIYPCCMSILHVHTACPCCKSFLYVLAACPRSMSTLHSFQGNPTISFKLFGFVLSLCTFKIVNFLIQKYLTLKNMVPKLAKFKFTERNPPENNQVTPAVWDRYILYAFGWIYMKTTCRLGFWLVSTFNGLNEQPYFHPM